VKKIPTVNLLLRRRKLDLERSHLIVNNVPMIQAEYHSQTERADWFLWQNPAMSSSKVSAKQVLARRSHCGIKVGEKCGLNLVEPRTPSSGRRSAAGDEKPAILGRG